MPVWLVAVVLTSGINLACEGGGPSSSEPDGRLITVDLDRSDPEALLSYYLAGYAGADPYDAGLLVAEGGDFAIDRVALDSLHPGLGARLERAADDGRLDWDGFEAFILATYYGVRDAPPRLDSLRAQLSYDGDGWFTVELDGVMTTARRRVYASEAAVRSALLQYEAHGEQLLYPGGTTFVGEHWQDGVVIEATVMRKRFDGAWDFFTYGPDGTLTTQTQPLPRSLKSPTQCVGCHYGGKLFEPARSFPAEAPDGPHGPRAYYLDEALRDADVVSRFDEHRKRSDHVLGLYGTLFVARMRADQRAGLLNAADTELLGSLGF